jgi:hypothetical protein
VVSSVLITWCILSKSTDKNKVCATLWLKI